MGKTTTARKYLAIDCHDSTLVFEAQGSDGRVEMTGTVATRRDAIHRVAESLGRPLEIVFEEGILAQWLYEELKPTADRIIVCDPRQKRRRGSKNDRIDVHDMADRLRRGELKPVFHETGSIQKLKELASVYQGLVLRQRSRDASNQVGLPSTSDSMWRRSRL